LLKLAQLGGEDDRLACPGGAPAATSRRPTAAAPSVNCSVGKPVNTNIRALVEGIRSALVRKGQPDREANRRRPSPHGSRAPSGSRSCPVFRTANPVRRFNLLSLFQAYNNTTSWIEDADLEQAAQASRAAMQAETENGWSR